MNKSSLIELLNKYSITEDSTKGDGNWDSMSHLSLLIDLCEFNNIELTLEMVHEINSINDIISKFNVNED
ncbi:MAG: acyl carrier protein [Lutibacter sp.]|nr:acyl carrier protein [Lutibacter sp.]